MPENSENETIRNLINSNNFNPENYFKEIHSGATNEERQEIISQNSNEATPNESV